VVDAPSARAGIPFAMNTKETATPAYDYDLLASQLADVEHLDDGSVRLGDGSVVHEYRWRQLQSRLAVHKGEATKRARLERERLERLTDQKGYGVPRS
jgi:hypothetical protein